VPHGSEGILIFWSATFNNPQGGLSEQSLRFREKWEKAFTTFLRETKGKRKEKERM
jgi:hypothetical protein